MTVQDLITNLEKFNPDDIVVLSPDQEGWQNIEEIVSKGSTVHILGEMYPLFSDG